MTVEVTGEAGFYANLNKFQDFADFADPDLYTPAPDDWLIIIADIRGSTEAVRKGRYKDVNMVGACCITAVVNVADEIDIPYVFGGDGATMVVPPELLQDCKTALIRTQAVAESSFNLRLRVGVVPVRDVRDRGQDVQIAKFELSRGNDLAMLSGGGIDLADKLIKGDDGRQGYLIVEESDGEMPDLTGLSCRWEPLKPRNGRMMCLLIQARGDTHRVKSAIYEEVMDCLNRIMDADVRQGSPVTEESLSLKWPPKGLSAEAAVTRGGGTFLRRYLALLVESWIQVICNLCNLTAGAYRAREYRGELQANSDFRRFDDMLRLVYDCSPDQVRSIRDELQARYQQGDLYFGLHEAREALMTCLVFSLEASEHVHFIDGGDGGFYAAAEGYKQQVRKG